jgi:hypothetical protein
MNRYLWPLIAVVALLVFLVMGLRHGDPRALPSPFIGKPAPQFELPTLKNPEVSIGTEHMTGNYALVNVNMVFCLTSQRAELFRFTELTGETRVRMQSGGSTNSAIHTWHLLMTRMAASVSTGEFTARPRPSWSIRKARLFISTLGRSTLQSGSVSLYRE